VNVSVIKNGPEPTPAFRHPSAGGELKAQASPKNSAEAGRRSSEERVSGQELMIPSMEGYATRPSGSGFAKGEAGGGSEGGRKIFL